MKKKPVQKTWNNWHLLYTHKVSLLFLFSFKKCQSGRYSVDIIKFLLYTLEK